MQATVIMNAKSVGADLSEEDIATDSTGHLIAALKQPHSQEANEGPYKLDRIDMVSDVNHYVMDALENILKTLNPDHPFFVCDLSDIILKVRLWKHLLPTVEAYYAVKCNTDPVVLRMMVILGMKFDCASQGEMNAVFTAGGKGSDIIYAHPWKPKSYLQFARSKNVNLMTFDSVEELLKIKEVFEEARLILRIEIPDVPAAFPLSHKFGCDVSQARHILENARHLDLNIVGVSFHVGSLCAQPSAFARAIGMARDVFDVAEHVGFHMTILDIGGGFPGAFGTCEIFHEMCSYINEALEQYFPEDSGVQIIAEPGCFLLCSASTLACKIIGRKFEETKVQQNHSNIKISYFLNNGVFGSFVNGFEYYGFKIQPLSDKSGVDRRETFNCRLWGNSCCSSDCILENIDLPSLEVGESLLFKNMGAYTDSFTTNFNGYPHPETYYVCPPQSIYNTIQQLPPYEEFCYGLPPGCQSALEKYAAFICNKKLSVNVHKNLVKHTETSDNGINKE